ncbi:MAG: YceD family protein [Enterococcus sp.]
MKWSLLELRKYQETPLTFHETLDLKKALMKRDNLVLDVAPVEVEGLVSVDNKGYLVHYTAQTTLTVPSTRSLIPVELPINLDINELFMTPEQYQRREAELPSEEILIIDGAQLDVTESIEDNILLAIPMRVLTDEEERSTNLPKGQDWEVLSEEEFMRRKMEEAETKVDPRLAKLSEFFDSTSEDDDKA